MNYIESQFGNPGGIIGHLVGLVMAYENRERNQRALSLLDIQPTDRILEIGFGPGWAIQQAGKLAVNGTVAGVDKSQTMVQQANFRNRAKVNAGQVILRQGSANAISFDDNTCDKVYAVNSFHEWEDQTRGIQEARRVLVRGGALLIVEHPHGSVSEEDLQAMQKECTGKLEEAGFIHVRFFLDHIQGRPAVAVRGIKP